MAATSFVGENEEVDEDAPLLDIVVWARSGGDSTQTIPKRVKQLDGRRRPNGSDGGC